MRQSILLPAVLICLVSGAPADAAPARKGKEDRAAEASKGAEPRKSLAETVEGTDRLEGLITFFRGPDTLHLLLSPDLLEAPLGFAAIRVNAGGDFALRGGSLDDHLVRWKRKGNHLVLVKENQEFRAEPGSEIAGAVEASFLDSPAFSAPLIRLRDEPTPLLIDASKLFGPDLAQVLPDLAGFAVKSESAILAWVKTFPDNVVARVIYRAERRDGGGGPGSESPFARFVRPGRLPDPRAAEMTVDYHFFRLPEDGFRPRFADERIGGWTVPYKDYTDADGRDTLFRHLLVRWQVGPGRPITFYMDRSVPAKWRTLVRESALWWNSAFAKAGIPDALRILDPPDDPDWDPADVRHSVIYWNLADNLVFSGAAGPSLTDPRTGQILKANVYLNGEFFSFALNRYLVYAWWRAPEPGDDALAVSRMREALRALRADRSVCDRAASFSSQIAFARLVLQARGVVKPGTYEAERFAREAFRELVAHEIGHALGFPHNWKASLGSTWDDVSSGRVTGRVDTGIFSTSVMDYDPIYLSPRGTPQGDYFMNEVGPYDDLAVEYLYRPFEHLSPAEETRSLDAIAAKAETRLGLIYDGGELNDIDPTSNADDLGDDPLSFADSRLRILHEEVLPRLPELVLAEGHDYNFLRQALDSAIFSVAMDYIDTTARQVGGQILLRRVAGSPAAAAGGPPPITPVPAAEQRRALDVLDERVFASGLYALPPDFLARLKADLQFDWNYPWRYADDYDLGSRITGLYEATLAVLLQPARLARVIDNERRVPPGGDRFTLPDLVSRLERTAFGDLSGNSIPADRRALQRAVLGRLVGLVLTPEKGTPAEASQLAASTLRSIRVKVRERLGRAPAPDGYARAHLEDMAARAERTLEASVQISPGGRGKS